MKPTFMPLEVLERRGTSSYNAENLHKPLGHIVGVKYLELGAGEHFLVLEKVGGLGKFLGHVCRRCSSSPVGTRCPDH